MIQSILFTECVSSNLSWLATFPCSHRQNLGWLEWMSSGGEQRGGGGGGGGSCAETSE